MFCKACHAFAMPCFNPLLEYSWCHAWTCDNTYCANKKVFFSCKDLCKELQKVSRMNNQGQYLTSRRGHEPDGQENRVISSTERATYVCQKATPSMTAVECNGQCSHCMKLLETVSALEQKNDDLNRTHLTEMEVSLHFHYVFIYVLIHLQQHFPLLTQILEQGYKEKINVSLNLFLLLYKSLFFVLTS